MVDVVDVSTDDSVITKLNSTQDGSMNIKNLTKEPFRMRVMWAENSHKHGITNLKPSSSDVIIMKLLLRFLMLSYCSGQVRSLDI